MKNLLLDICLVLLILLIGSNILNPQTLNQETFNTNIENFNEDVKTSMLDSHYQLSKDPYPNRVSEFVEGVSDLSRDGIRVVVETFVKAFHGF